MVYFVGSKKTRAVVRRISWSLPLYRGPAHVCSLSFNKKV